jgi:predicted RNA-binding protein YlxR (DUF448 family)
MRTCTGCRVAAAQGTLVRVVFEGPRLVVDRARRLPGRGAYVHPIAKCVTIAGLARSLRRSVTPDDVKRVVADLSPENDNSGGNSDPGPDQSRPTDLTPGLQGAKTVETRPRIKAKDDRSEDARV